MSTHRHNHHLFWGIVFILLGAIILIDSADLLDIGTIFSRYWPLFLIAIGIMLLYRNERNLVGGSFLILIGIYFQLDRLEWIYYPYKAYFFAISLIILGAILLYYSSRKKEPSINLAKENEPPQAESPSNSNQE